MGRLPPRVLLRARPRAGPFLPLIADPLAPGAGCGCGRPLPAPGRPAPRSFALPRRVWDRAVLPSFLCVPHPCRYPQIFPHPSFHISLPTSFFWEVEGALSCFCFPGPQDGPPSPTKSGSKYVTAHRRTNVLRLPMEVWSPRSHRLSVPGEGGGA